MWQPHTSAGRVPTDAGYRCYVDMLLDDRRSTKDVSAVEARLRQEAGDAPLMDDLLSSTSHVLSEASKGVGFAIAPPNAQALFQRIEFVPLSGSADSRGHGRQRQPGVAEDRRHRRIGDRLASWCRRRTILNSEFSGRTLDEVRDGVIERLQQERSLYDQLLGLALRLASTLVREPRSSDLGLHRRHVDAARRGGRRPAGISAVDAAGVVAHGRRKAAPGANAERVHRWPRPDRRDRRRAQRSRAAPVQPDRLDLLRWPQHRHGRRHRSDPHALSTRRSASSTSPRWPSRACCATSTRS